MIGIYSIKLCSLQPHPTIPGAYARDYEIEPGPHCIPMLRVAYIENDRQKLAGISFENNQIRWFRHENWVWTRMHPPDNAQEIIEAITPLVARIGTGE
jgi:hypothetical protein